MKPHPPFKLTPAATDHCPDPSLRVIVRAGEVVDARRLRQIRREVLQHRAMLDRWREVKTRKKWRRA